MQPAPSFQAFYENFGFKAQDRKTIDTLKHALKINAKVPSQDTELADAAPHPSSVPQEQSAFKQEMAWEEAERFYSDQLQAFITRAAKEALPDILKTGFEMLNSGSKNNTYDFIKRVQTKLAHNEASNDWSDQNVEQ